MAELFEGQEVYSASGERIGAVARVDEGGFAVRATFLDGDVRCDQADIASVDQGRLELSLTQDQLRERKHSASPGATVETAALANAQGARDPGTSPAFEQPARQGGERLEPADEEPQGGDRLELGNDASSPLSP